MHTYCFSQAITLASKLFEGSFRYLVFESGLFSYSFMPLVVTTYDGLSPDIDIQLLYTVGWLFFGYGSVWVFRTENRN